MDTRMVEGAMPQARVASYTAPVRVVHPRVIVHTPVVREVILILQ